MMIFAQRLVNIYASFATHSLCIRENACTFLLHMLAYIHFCFLFRSKEFEANLFSWCAPSNIPLSLILHCLRNEWAIVFVRMLNSSRKKINFTSSSQVGETEYWHYKSHICLNYSSSRYKSLGDEIVKVWVSSFVARVIQIQNIRSRNETENKNIPFHIFKIVGVVMVTEHQIRIRLIATLI